MLDLPLGSRPSGDDGAAGGDDAHRGGRRDRSTAPSPPRRRWPWLLALLAVVVIAALVGYLAPRAGPAVATVEPPLVDFGERRVGSGGDALEVRVGNAGERPLRVERVDLEGGPFAVAADGCSGRTLAAGEACRLEIAFDPTDTGGVRAALEIVSDAPNSPLRLPLVGEGTAPRLAVDRSDVSFGPVPVGERAPPAAVTVSNRGSAGLELGGLAIEGAAAGDFELGEDRCSGSELAPGQACTVQLAFRPAAAGERAARLRVPGAGVAAASVGLAGMGMSAEMVTDLGSGAVDFGPVVMGRASAPRRVRVSNSGEAAMTVRRVALADPGQGFEVVSEECTAGPVEPGGACAVEVRFSPAREGLATTVLRVGGGPAGGLEIPLAGTGVAPRLEVAPGALELGAVPVGRRSPSSELVVRNAGSGPLKVARVEIGGGDAAAFEVAADRCAGESLEPGASCAVAVRYAPRREGGQSAELRLSSNAVGGPRAVRLSGRGVVPRIEADRSRIRFQSVPSGRSVEERVVVTSAGSGPLEGITAEVVGSAAADYAVSAADCAGRRLTAGERCTLVVRFAPRAQGRRTAVLTLSAEGGARPVEIGLDGSGGPPPRPRAAVAPALVDFGSRPVGSRSDIRTVTLSNPGEGPLRFEEPRIEGGAASDFSLVPGSCAGAPYLAPAGDCTVGVRFLPSAAGRREARLVIRHDAAGGRAEVRLSGEAVAGP